jgi:propanediol dehydratase small subunit
MSGTRALSGKPVSELTLDAVRRGDVSLPDLRIHPETLNHQASVAQAHGNPQLAENLRRAAELTLLPDEEVLAIYEALRPHRSTPQQLTALAGSLAGRGLPRCAALLSEAAEVYARRGLAG